MFKQLNWRPDRIEHIANHNLTPEEVEEAVFDDLNCLLIRGPFSERNRDKTYIIVSGVQHEDAI